MLFNMLDIFCRVQCTLASKGTPWVQIMHDMSREVEQKSNGEIHPLHLSTIFFTNLGSGYSTPPVGLNLFLGSLRFERSIPQLYRASWPLLLVLGAVLLLITYMPDLSVA